MLIAIRKNEIYLTGPDIIPSVTQVAECMKNLRFRGFEMTYANQASQSSRYHSSDFDIDLYLLTVDQFIRLSDPAKQLFLHHFQLFLQYHSKAFLLRFNESPNSEGKSKSDNVVQRCRAFLYLIADICIGKDDP